ncbi:MAG: TIGR03560 family F420-dependent LLM class oxidoreductase [Nitrososphaerales archaeon]
MVELVLFGLMVPQGWHGELNTLPKEKYLETIFDFVRWCENSKVESIWLYDHFIQYKAESIGPCFEGWMLLSYLAPITRKVRLGMLVLCNSYRNPALVAKMAATLDNISQGRLEFGIGAGWYEAEYRSYGYDYPKASTRILMLKESLEVITKMWCEEKPSFKGRYYSIKDAYCYPKPLQHPHPPITVGGSGRLTLKVVAQYADWSNYNGSVERVKQLNSILDEHCRSIDRDAKSIRRSLHWVGVLDKSREKAFAKAKSLNIGVEPHICGSSEDWLAAINTYAELGFERFIFFLPDFYDEGTLDLLYEGVISKFSG